MEFVVGSDPEAFRRYYETLEGVAKKTGTLNGTEGKIIAEDPSHLIVWREGDKIIGHAIWHESSTSEHRTGDPRDEEDREILGKLLGGEKELVELHEIWLREEHRGKGYGKRFFEFFEEFIRNRGYRAIAHYVDHPAGVAICRQRGYKEGYLSSEAWYVFVLHLD
jgi:GNAT superfamily N-acetyltransferase